MSTEEGQRFAEEHGLRFFETSCLTPFNVTEVREIGISKEELLDF